MGEGGGRVQPDCLGASSTMRRQLASVGRPLPFHFSDPLSWRRAVWDQAIMLSVYHATYCSTSRGLNFGADFLQGKGAVFGKMRSRSFHRHIARHLHSPLCRGRRLEQSSEGCVFCCVLDGTIVRHQVKLKVISRCVLYGNILPGYQVKTNYIGRVVRNMKKGSELSYLEQVAQGWCVL